MASTPQRSLSQLIMIHAYPANSCYWNRWNDPIGSQWALQCRNALRLCLLRFFCFRTVHAEQCNGSVHYQYIAKIRKYHATVTPTLARSCACSAHRRIVDGSPLIATPTKVFDWFHIVLHVGWAKRVLNTWCISSLIEENKRCSCQFKSLTQVLLAI